MSETKSKHDGMVRGFHWSAKAWYASPECSNSISVGMYNSGTTGEFQVIWHDVYTDKQTPRVEIFEDGWSLFAEFADLFEWLAKCDGKNITQDALVSILLSLGFEDLTQYESPCE